MPERPRLLSSEPRDKAIDMAELVGIANAIEAEAVARYDRLAQLMEQRGFHETVKTFRAMSEFEKGHVGSVQRWARSLGQEVGPAHQFVWRIPQEIGASWEEVENSSLLTPYRALAIAVTNEERAFAFYVYIAANATDPDVRREAEIMAHEELAHAAELRVHRRRAFHREHATGKAPARSSIATVAEFRALEQQLENEIAVVHRRIAGALAALGDDEGAALLQSMVRTDGPTSALREEAAPPGGAGRDRLALLRAALRPLEHASEVYEDLIVHAPSEDLLAAEQAALRGVVERISLLGERINEEEGWGLPKGSRLRVQAPGSRE